MKTLNQILTESASDAELKLLKTFLKTMGFTKAESGPKTYETNVSRVLELYGIAMRAGHWADVYVAITDDSVKPYTIVTAEGTERYVKINDVIKSLQGKMHSIKEEEYDVVGETLSMLDQISEMTEELYDTFADHETLDEDVVSEVKSIYSHVDDFYNMVDEKYGIESDEDEYDFSEIKEESDVVNEQIDYTKFKRLASLGLVNADEINKLILAMKSLESGKPISASQKDIIGNTFLSLIAIVTGDSAVLGKITQDLKQ